MNSPRARFARLLGRTAQAAEATTLPDLVPGPGRLVFAAVCLDPLLEDVTAVAEPRTFVAVTGPDATAASALLAVAARRIAPQRGRVSIDGQDLAAHSPASVERAVARVMRPDGPDAGSAPRVLVLDGSSRRLDGVISAWRGRATILVATQRRDLVEAADSVWHLEDGRIVESGPPQALLAPGRPTALLLD